MFRRKTKNSTAYTGVGHAAPSAQQPNNNAMAAALTIGQNLKLSQPDVYAKPRAPSLRKQPVQRSSLSLLKRSSLLQNTFAATLTPRHSRTGLGLLVQKQPPSHEYNVDDSFTDSVLEQMGREADAHYSNEARLRDLKLHHQPPQPKMVKKYIPTPNGIQIVEVPEASMKQEIARSNSMRSLPRSGLLSRIPRALSMSKQRRNPNLRLSSLVQAPRIDENAELETSAAIDDLELRRRRELDALHAQIEHEKQLAKDLELKRLEFERLKQLRLENEKKMRALQILEEEEAHREASTSPAHQNGAVFNAPDISELTFVSTDQGVRETKDSEDEEDVPVMPVPFVVDEMEHKQLKESLNDSADLLSSPITPEPTPVIEATAPNQTTHQFEAISTSPHDAIVDNYAENFLTYSQLEPSPAAASEDEFGIQEVPKDSFDSPNLATQLRPNFASKPQESEPETLDTKSTDAQPTWFETAPEKISAQDSSSPKFDPVPEIIDDLTVPPPNLAGSIRSVSSMDSKLKPMKSAMKTPKSSYSSNGNTAESPAHQAYLSLTTAENTRLNSKLSASQLNDFNAQQEARAPAPKSPNVQQKRMSTLRKQPSASNPGGMAGRSLRPQSYAETSPSRPAAGMSSRLKNQSLPFPTHPASQPNYQSPSKLKAAELYAKANKRPISEFQPLQRKSSFSREIPGSDGVPPRVHPQRVSRMSMRDPPAAVAPQRASSPQNPPTQPAAAATPANGGFAKFKSKIADSDDETDVSTSYHNGGGGFVSRFNDSDDEAAPKSSRLSESAPITSLRGSEDKSSKKKKDGKEKKQKKGVLKKLFGRN